MQKPDLGTRVGSMVLDHLAMTFIAFIFIVPIYFMFIVNVAISQVPSFENPMIFVAIIGYALYFNKDMVEGRSLAKRGLNLQVVNAKTGLAASPYRCLLRNALLIIWPIEFIVALVNPEQRLGDMIAGTKVVKYDKTIEQPKINYTKIILSFLIAYLVFFPFALLIYNIQDFTDSVSYEMQRGYDDGYSDHNQRNNLLSEQIQNTLSDSLGQSIIPKLDVSIVSSYDRKLHGRIRVKSGVLTKEKTVYSIHNQVLLTLHSAYPHLHFFGIIEYSYLIGDEKKEVDIEFDTDDLISTYNKDEEDSI